MIDRKNILLISVIVIIASIIGLLIPYLQSSRQNIQNTNQNINQNKPTVEINYVDSGFVPRSVKVKLGTTVSWVNNSTKPMWVASDPHPSHDGLPGFDEAGAILPHPGKKSGLINKAFAHHSENSVYKYTFMKIGTWKYHNHIYAGDTGEIIVEE